MGTAYDREKQFRKDIEVIPERLDSVEKNVASVSEYKTSRLNMVSLGMIPNQDNASVFKAILESHGGDILYLPKGIYYINNEIVIEDVDDLTIYFDGEIRPLTQTDGNTLKFINCKNLKLYDLKINAEFKVFRPLRFWKCSGLHLHKPSIINVGKEDFIDNEIRDPSIPKSASIGIELKAECHNTTIVEPYICNVFNDYFSSGIQINGTNFVDSEVDLTKLSKHIRIIRPYIENVYPRADGDGIFAAGKNFENIDGIVEGGTFINCRKRALKFQQAGWKSMNNTMIFVKECMAPIDFQGGSGMTINDTIIFDGFENEMFTLSLVEAKLGDITIDGLRQKFVNGVYTELIGIVEGEGTTTALCRMYDEATTYPEHPNGNITIRNCNVDLVACLLFIDTVDGTGGIDKITVENVSANLYTNYIIKSGANGKITKLNYRNNSKVKYLNPEASFFFKKSTFPITNSDIDIRDVPITFEIYNLHTEGIADGSSIKIRTETNEFHSRNFDFEKGKYIFYAPAIPSSYTYSNGIVFEKARVGDICINTAPVVNEGSLIEKWICTANPATETPRGTWQAITHTVT